MSETTSSKTTSLNLPLVQERQAQKHITVNEGLKILDVLVQLAVEAISSTPPSDAEEGEVYIIGDNPSGAWEGKAHHLAVWDRRWVFFAPQIGWTAWNKADHRRRTFYNGAWREASLR